MKELLKRVALATLACCFAASMAGCQNYNYSEPEDLQFVAGMAIDRTADGLMEITVELESAKSGENPELKAIYLYSNGQNLEDAKRNMLMQTNKALYWGHMDLAIISQEIATDYMNETIDLLTRLQTMRLGLKLVVSSLPTASEVLTMEGAEVEAAPLNSDSIVNSLKIQKRLGKAPEVEFYQFLDAVMDEGMSAYLPMVGIDNSNKKPQLDVSGTAVFNSSYLIGTLDENETRTFLIATGVQKVAVFPLPMDPGGAFSNAAVEVLPDRVNIKPTVVDGKPSVDISVKSDFSVLELNGASNDKKQFKQTCDALQRNTAMMLENEIVALIEKTKTMNGADILGIGSTLQDSDPQQWKQITGKWNDLYQQMQVTVRAEMKLRNTGLIQEPLRKGD